MDFSFKVIFAVAFELLFFFNAVTLLLGLRRLKLSGAQLLAERPVKLQVYSLLLFSLLTQVVFWCMLARPYFYIFAIVSGCSAVYASVMASEGFFSFKGKEVWVGFKSYPRGKLQVEAAQPRRRKINVLLKADGKQFVLRTTPSLWEEIEKKL